MVLKQLKKSSKVGCYIQLFEFFINDFLLFFFFNNNFFENEFTSA